jgi:hypothetical protein
VGRHRQCSDHRFGRVVRTAAAIGLGVAPALVPSLASAAPPPPAPNPVPAPPAPASALPAPTSATPCAVTAKACVDISEKKAWLTDGAGHLTRGPVPVTTGAPGEDTPQGTFHVMWKDQFHHSREQNGVPMPYSVFFADGGRAFHGGSLEHASAGCVHLGEEDAKAFFNYLQVHDEVQVVP